MRVKRSHDRNPWIQIAQAAEPVSVRIRLRFGYGSAVRRDSAVVIDYTGASVADA